MRCTAFRLMAALTLCSSALHADPAGDARHAIQAAYAAVDAATAHKDVAGVTAYLAPGYTSTDTKGTVTDTAQERQSAAQVFAAAQSLTAKTTIVSFTLNAPGQATVTEHGRLTVILPATAQSGKPIKTMLDGTSHDVWVKTAQGWREKSDRALTESFTVNGKPLPNS